MIPVKQEKHRGMVTVVIDFDGVLAESDWPSNTIGAPIQQGIDLLLHYFGERNEIVIFTARPESHKPWIWAWLKAQGLAEAIHDVVCGKPRGWLYIDDNAFNPFGQPSVTEPEPEDDDDVILMESVPPDALPVGVRVAREPSPQVRDEEERRRQQAARRRGDDSIAWESMD